MSLGPESSPRHRAEPSGPQGCTTAEPQPLTWKSQKLRAVAFPGILDLRWAFPEQQLCTLDGVRIPCDPIYMKFKTKQSESVVPNTQTIPASHGGSCRQHPVPKTCDLHRCTHLQLCVQAHGWMSALMWVCTCSCALHCGHMYRCGCTYVCACTQAGMCHR